MSGCGLGSIAWCDFSWDAFATLLAGALTFVAGVLAVGAALYVAKKQNAILRRQTEILERQARSDESAHRHDMFDRRFTIYELAQQFIIAATLAAERVAPALEAEFSAAVNRSQFLFESAVYRELKDVLDTATTLGDRNRELEAGPNGARFDTLMNETWMF